MDEENKKGEENRKSQSSVNTSHHDDEVPEYIPTDENDIMKEFSSLKEHEQVILSVMIEEKLRLPSIT